MTTTASASALRRRVLVTGSSRGIGAEIARTFAANGDEVALHGRDETALRELQGSLADQGRTTDLHLADLTDPAQVRRLADAVGDVEVLIVNAGGTAVGFGPLEEIEESVFCQTLDANLTSASLTLRAFLPGMKRRGRGSIVTMSSASAHIAHERSPIAYAAAKAGIESMTKNLAVQLGPYGVRINAIAPETILTEANRRQIPEAQQEELALTHPLRRLGEPHDVARVALFLASEDAAWITGTVIDVAGGAVTR